MLPIALLMGLPALAAVTISLVYRWRYLVAASVLLVLALQSYLAWGLAEEAYLFFELSLGASAPVRLLLLVALAVAAVGLVSGAWLGLGRGYLLAGLGMVTGVTAASLTHASLPLAAMLLLCGGLLAILALAEGKTNQRQAESKFLLAMVAAGASLLAAFALLASYQVSREPAMLAPLAALLAVGFGLLLAGFPFHFWLPDLAERSPMMGVMVVGTLGTVAAALFLSVVLGYPWLLLSEQATTLFTVLGAATALAGALVALGQASLPRLVAYTVVSGVGFILVGLASAVESGAEGAILVVANQAFASSLLLLCVASLGEAGGSLSELEGSAGGRPFMTVGLVVGGLAMAGVPPTSGFVARWLIYQTAAEKSLPLLLTLLAASALTFLCYLRLYQRLWAAPNRSSTPLPLPLAMLVLTLSLVLVVGGLYPSPLVQLVRGALQGVSP